MRGGCSALLALVIILGSCVPAWSAELPYSILEASDRFGEGGYTINGERSRGYIQDFEYLTATKPGAEYFLPLRVQDFEWEKVGDVSRPPSLSSRVLERVRFELRLDYEEGQYIFDTIKLAVRDDQIGILIDFVDAHHSLETVEFEVKAQLCSMGAAIDGAEFNIAGDFGNRNRSVYSSSGTVQLGVGRKATGMRDAYGVKFDLGAGVVLTGDLLFADEAYGAASARLTAEDKALMAKHPGITGALHLKTINLAGKVRIGAEEDAVRYVYNSDLDYLGTTRDNLRLTHTYYLAREKL